MDLCTARLRLRPICAEDLGVAIASAADARVMQWLGGVQTAEQSRAWLDRQIAHWVQHGCGRFVVTREGAFVGFAGLWRFDFDRGLVPGIEIAWRLSYEHWGKGYATEAARAVLDDAFGRLGLAEVVAITAARNARSRRVMERLGMVYAPDDTAERSDLPEGDPKRTHVVYRLAREPTRY
jgi:ribosomal-protein-alanine N-acetyltransferase